MENSSDQSKIFQTIIIDLKSKVESNDLFSSTEIDKLFNELLIEKIDRSKIEKYLDENT